jgi:hypothetical protein
MSALQTDIQKRTVLYVRSLNMSVPRCKKAHLAVLAASSVAKLPALTPQV